MPQATEKPDAPEGDVRTVSFVSLGCPKNLVDSEKMLGLLAEDGLTPVSYDPQEDIEHGSGPAGSGDISASGSEQAGDAGGHDVDPADAVVINTCGFLEASKNESLAAVRAAVAAKERGDVKRVVVAGCLVQRHRAKMLEWVPGIDAMVGVFDRDKIVEAVRGEKKDREALETADTPKYWIAGSAMHAARERGISTTGLTVNGKDGKGTGYFESDAARLRLTPRHYAYLRMSEGCNQACAFCTIPSIRGKMRSKGLHAVADEAAELVRDGAYEIMLIGQDTTSYGDDVGLGLGQAEGNDPYRAGLPLLLKTVSEAMENASGSRGRAAGWLRLMYAYPSNFTDEIIDAFAEMSARGPLVPYIDIPLQHGSSRMLERMRRHVTAEHQTELMHKLHERVPGIAIRTTFITGFPGETEADHEALLGFIEEVGFDAVGVFDYSPEAGTPAARMDRDPELHVPDEIKKRRRAEIMELQQGIAFEQNEYLAEQWDDKNPLDTGVRLDVLIDKRTGAASLDTAGVNTPGQLHQGRTYFQAPQIDATTFVHSREALSPGELVPCVIVGSDGYDLIARPVVDLERRVSLDLL